MSALTINSISKRTRNAITSRLKSASDKYGIDVTRLVANHFFNNYKEKTKKQKKIDELKAELKKLESKR